MLRTALRRARSASSAAPRRGIASSLNLLQLSTSDLQPARTWDAAEADGAPLWGQVVGQPEPGPLMDERVLRRLCGMLGVPAAGSLADQAAACRAQPHALGV